MRYVKDFKDLNKDDVASTGGKGVSLAEMTRAGIPVPLGFVLLAGAFDQFLKETDVNVEIDSILRTVKRNEIHTVEHASEKIRALILNAVMPENIAEEIKRAFTALGVRFVAVRSSATAEDSATAAWAGQLDSFLNTTETTLLENVKKCWASLFTPRAIFYRFEKNLHRQEISVAVVVQKMVESDTSGIAFSVHPITQDANQLIIEAGFGLGEAIVSGSVTPDSYVVEKEPRRIIDKNIQTQSKGLYCAKNGGNEWRDISKERAERQVLSDTEILELSGVIVKIENHYGFPCDVEWAIEDGKLYIVQSRPITTNGSSVSDEPRYERMEHMENIYPLDIFSLELGWGDLSKRKEYNVPEVEFVLDFRKNTVTLYCDGNRYHVAAKKILEILINSPHLQEDLKSRSVNFLNRVSECVSEIKHKKYTSLGDAHERIQKLLYENSFLFIEENITSLHSTTLDQKLKSVIKDHALIPHILYPKEVSSFQRYDLSLLELCIKLGDRKLVSAHDLEKYREDVHALINEYSWITAGFNEKPRDTDRIIQEIHDILQSGKNPKELLAERKKLIRDSLAQASFVQKELERTISKGDLTVIKVAQQLINQGQARIEWLLKLIFVSRSIYERIATEYGIAIEKLKFLTPDEVSRLLSGKLNAPEKIIAKRESRFIVSIKGGRVSYLDSFNVILDDDENVLKGQSAYPGKAKGIVKIVNSSSDIGKVTEGDILVSSRTSPELVPAMQKAGAIISELGGLLCHAAIVSREMKKPCIVGVKNAVSTLKDGDMIEVDATAGLLKKI